jgi:hypothetical protein
MIGGVSSIALNAKFTFAVYAGLECCRLMLSFLVLCAAANC